MGKSKKDEGLALYSEADMVAVVDELGNELPAVPKAWIGTDLIPTGVSVAGAAKAEPAVVQVDPTVEPSASGTKAAWVAFAKAAKGAVDTDLVDEAGKALTRDALRDKYGSQAPAPAGSGD